MPRYTWMGVSGFVVATSALLALAASLPSLGQSNDWPQFGGPRRNAVSNETGLLKSWPANGPTLLWKASGLGTGFSSVAITGGRIYSMGDLKNDQGGKDQCVIALDLATRKKLWATRVGPPHDDGSRCTPTVNKGLVFALGTSGDLVCLDAVTGALKWKKNLTTDFGGAMMSGWKWSESPLVDGNKVVVTPGSNSALLVALDKTTGNLIWKCEATNLGDAGKDGAGYSSIVAATICGTPQYVQFTGRGIVGVEAATGKFLWVYGHTANNVANITSPIVKGDYVFGSSAYGAGSGLVNITKNGSEYQATEVYHIPAGTFSNHHGGVVLVGDYLYGGHGQNAGAPTCIEFATGKVAWKGKAVGNGSASVVDADGHLYMLYDNGVMALIEANPNAFTVTGSFQLPTNPGTAWAHPVILNGKLYIRWDDSLYCYNVKG